jgi:hypothetical protein
MVFNISRDQGEVAGARYWLRQMERHIDSDLHVVDLSGNLTTRRTLRGALLERAASIAAFSSSRRLFPAASVPVPVLYPFSGVDVLTPLHFFPNSSITMLANLHPGKGLSCFSDLYCVRMASRSTYKVVQNWVHHHLAWLETHRMLQLFDESTGCLPALLFLLHVGGHTFDQVHPLATYYGSGDDSAPPMARPLQAAVDNERNGTSSTPPLSGMVIRSGHLRVTYAFLTLQEDGAAFQALHRLRVVHAGHEPRYAAMLKAAPDEITSLAWFERWLLERSVSILQDETGIPIARLGGPPSTASPGNQSAVWERHAFGNYSRMQLGRRVWNIIEFGHQSKVDGAAMQNLFDTPELPFPFGYAAGAAECAAMARRLNRALGDNGTKPCNGVLLAAWRMATSSHGIRGHATSMRVDHAASQAARMVVGNS